MKKSVFLAVFLEFFMTTLLVADEVPVSKGAIGRIISLQKRFWDMRITGPVGARHAVVDGYVFERDSIQTVAKQRLILLLDDGTELLIGPGSRVTLKNWNDRDSRGRRERVIWLQAGMLKAKVRKIYSQDEPFIVENKNGLVAVRGTEFVVEAPSGTSELELHTLEGEVHFARDREALTDSAMSVSVRAGQTSIVRSAMAVPQQPHAFDLKQFKAYFAKAAPGVNLNVVRSTSNTQRAELAVNARNISSPRSISPAQPAFASLTVRKPPAGVVASTPSRALASVSSASSSNKDSAATGGYASVEKRRPRDSTLAVSNQSSSAADRKKQPMTVDGVRDALNGGMLQDANEKNGDVNDLPGSLAGQNGIIQSIGGPKGSAATATAAASAARSPVRMAGRDTNPSTVSSGSSSVTGAKAVLQRLNGP